MRIVTENKYRRMEILTQGYSCTDDSTYIEDSPEDTNKCTLLALSRVGHHQRSLSSPQKTCADAENSTCSDHERARMRVNVHRPRR